MSKQVEEQNWVECVHGTPGGCRYVMKPWEDLPFFICYQCEHYSPYD